MAVVVTSNDGPGGRPRRYVLGGPDDPEVKRRKWPPPLLLADGTPDHDLLDAMAEVDALTPACPPIYPGLRNQMGPWPEPPRPPDAPDVEVYPHGRRDVPAWSRIDQRPPPPPPQRTGRPGPGTLVSR